MNQVTNLAAGPGMYSLLQLPEDTRDSRLGLKPQIGADERRSDLFIDFIPASVVLVRATN